MDKDTVVVEVKDLVDPSDLQGEARGRHLVRWIQHQSKLHHASR